MLEITPQITPEILKLIAEIDEFKGQWSALKTLSPETLSQLRQIATIESIGSSTRIEGSRLTDKEVAELLSNIKVESFRGRDDEEVVGYAAATEMVFESWDSITPTENHIRQLHRVLLQHSTKDERPRGDYKKIQTTSSPKTLMVTSSAWCSKRRRHSTRRVKWKISSAGSRPQPMTATFIRF